MPDKVKMPISNFEVMLRECPHDMRMALIEVLDTAEMCQRWFERRCVPYHAADLVSMTELVLKREDGIRRAERADDE